MNPLLNRRVVSARRATAVCVVVFAALLSGGAYSGDADVLGHAAVARGFILALPRSVTLGQGASAQVTVVIRRRHFGGPVKLAVTSKLPRGLTARFSPTKARGARSVLTLRATSRVRVGRYVLGVRGTGRSAKRTVKLALSVTRPGTTTTPAPGGTTGTTPGDPTGSGSGGTTTSGGTSKAATGSGSGTASVGPAFSISGDPSQALEPGISEPIDLQIQNPNSSSLTLSTLTAAVSAVSAPQATPALPCTASNFVVQQYSGGLPLVVAPNSTVSLQQLGVPVADWPQVSMLDTNANQDGCQGASLSLSYGAAASLGG